MRVFLEHTQYWLYKSFTNANYRKFIWFSIIYGSKKRFVNREISFDDFSIFTPDTISFIWQFKEIFADESYKFVSNSSKPVILDCGANIGVSCLYFTKLFPNSKIVAFEADPNIVKVLNKNLSSNNIRNVEIIDKAVWINNDVIEISLEGADGASIYSKNNLINVNSVRLKDYLENEIKIDMLKMDIEGAEYEVLKDCRDSLGMVENIFIEYHSFTNEKQQLSEIISILEQNNFRYFIKPVNDREMPFVIRKNKSNPAMDLQLNIYGHKIN